MTLHWATIFARNWTCRPDVPIKMINALMEAIHEVPSILMHWNNQHSFNEIVLQLSRFDERSWKQQVEANVFAPPDLIGFFRDRLRDFTPDEATKE